MSPRFDRRRIFQLVSLLGLVALLVVFRQPIIAWFTGEPVGAGDAGEGIVTQAGDLRLRLALDPDPPKQKGNALLIEAMDASGDPVEDAKVEVTYSMPAMGAMPEMKGTADVDEVGEGRYRATFDLPMAGSYTLTTEVTAPAGDGIARHTLTVGSPGLIPAGGNAMAASDGPATKAAPPALSPVALAPPTLEYVRAAFAAYDGVRALLAEDTLEGLRTRSEEIAAALTAAAQVAAQAPVDVAECLGEGVGAAQLLGAAATLEAARERFSALSLYLVALAAADPRLQEGYHIFECPMFKDGFNKWFQRPEDLANPYMGTRMPSCGSASQWEIALPAAAAEAEHVHADGDIAHYTCSMHPSIKQQGPGTCPICGMDLIPVTRTEVESGVIVVDEGRRQVIGVKTAPITIAPLDLDVRALGVITYDETKLADITLKLDGYIHDLKVNATGEPVDKGDVLFTLYSPELYAAQQEYLLALGSASEANESLVRASKKRLVLWGLTETQIRQIAARGEPIENMPFLSPASGYVIEKNVVEGAAIKSGERLFRIAPLNRVWVEADVYERDLPQIEVGQPVVVTLPYMPGRSFEGKVAYVYPTLEQKTRTGKVRIELPNKELILKPDMYADVVFDISTGPVLQVPESAVIYTGPRTLVFVDLGQGRLMPKEVQLGRQGEDSFEVLEGLEPGDVVVTSGNFLIAAESRIRSAADYWSAQ